MLLFLGLPPRVAGRKRLQLLLPVPFRETATSFEKGQDRTSQSASSGIFVELVNRRKQPDSYRKRTNSVGARHADTSLHHSS